MISELRDLSYKSRLSECGLTTLETRRLRGYQIEVFIVNGYEDIDRNMFFKGSRTRGYKAALVTGQCRLDMRKYSPRVINEWNKLLNDYVNANSVNIFKIELTDI